jgi:hypothetical protein
VKQDRLYLLHADLHTDSIQSMCPPSPVYGPCTGTRGAGDVALSPPADVSSSTSDAEQNHLQGCEGEDAGRWAAASESQHWRKPASAVMWHQAIRSITEMHHVGTPTSGHPMCAARVSPARERANGDNV